MTKQKYLSDETMIAQKSLLDAPLFFQTNLASGYIFYLGIDSKNSGDFFVIKDGSCLTISLVGDIEDRGVLGKSRLEDIRPHITNIIESALHQDKNFVSNALNCLDKHLIDDNGILKYMISFSYVKILNKHKIQYLNIGENKLFFRKSGTLLDKSAYPGGKLGIFNLYLSKHSSKKPDPNLIPIEEELSKDDRIFICTDDVKEYVYKRTARSTIPYITKILKADLPLEDAIIRINKNMNRRLSYIHSDLQDDYTLLLLKLQ